MREHVSRAACAPGDYLGHPSVRLDADRILIKPKHSPKVRGMDRMRPEDMSVIDLDGKQARGKVDDVLRTGDLVLREPDYAAAMQAVQRAAVE